MARALLDPELVFRDLKRAEADALVTRFSTMSRQVGGEALLGFFNGISTDDDRML
jgi:hypothetical protein